MITQSRILAGMGTYAFVDVRNEVRKLKAQGITPIDFGIGDPKAPTPVIVREACKKAIDARATSGYPSEPGEPEFRQAVADWTKRRFGATLDPDTQVCATVGAKEAVFNFPLAFINPGDYVIMPNPGYPPYEKGTLFAHGKCHFLPVDEENTMLPDISSIPSDIARKAKILWLNSPHNPTGKVAPRAYLRESIDFGKDNDIIIAADECYSEMYFEQKPTGILELAQEGVVSVQSLSKRSNMTCYRVGWIAGDQDIVGAFKKLKPNIDSGTATFIQDAAMAALGDETHVKQMRDEYQEKRDIMVDALEQAGLPRCVPEATLYIWQKVPKGMTSVDFAKALLKPEVAVVSTPGSWLSKDIDGKNPGEGYVRLALVPTMAEIKAAAERIGKLRF
ncbi:hypothetical protein AUJ68_06905 [Candidatus Woesearchaeota archaeon CG1_02_57_44]|nr:MAG: hypothetical protein AUJ68_06905 [Candidatus Woesearchaeota archaeon CG1_02_57_44]